MKLYHGTSSDKLAGILEDGVDAPSYWGTLEEASRYDLGVMIEIETEDYDLDLVPNDLLISTIEDESGPSPELEEAASSWEASLRVLGSVRIENIVMISGYELVGTHSRSIKP